MANMVGAKSKPSRDSSQHVPAAKPNEREANSPVGTMPATILLVEDDPNIIDVVAHILEDEGYQVVRATGARSALSALQETRPDLIVSDVMMPGISGFAFFQRVRADSDWSRIPFIFLTAKTELTDMRFGMGLGADDYLTKPFDPEDLLIAVQVRLELAARRGARG
jgi:DNA-binding response OmpR family regulator